MKAFYSNLKIIEEGNLLSEDNNKKIIVTPCDWMLLARLKYDGPTISKHQGTVELRPTKYIALNASIRVRGLESPKCRQFECE